MAEVRDFLFEIGSEEMPSAPLQKAIAQFNKLVVSGLKDSGLSFGEVKILSTPRRLTAYVKDVAEATEEISEVKRGPKAEIAFDAEGKPTKAAEGFARKCGVSADALTRRVDTDGHEYVFAELNIPSVPATKILSELATSWIAALDWPRSQRWGSFHERYVRPVRWLCVLFGSEIVPVTYADVTSSNTTQGHRVLGPGYHEVATPADYEQVLKNAGVLLQEQRKDVILAGIKEVEAARPGSHVDMPEKVFEEVINLTEWPQVLVGTFDEEFLNVPSEIITESMLSNQRYFPIYDAEGKLTREFIVVSNADPSCAERVIDGNERVVRARLDDAKFFFEEDLKHTLDEFVQRLETVVFQEKLGTVLQKTQRMEALAAEIALDETSNKEEAELAARAAHLAKADLVSQAVVEFTSQQGVMGGYYAEAAGEKSDVAAAIREHYRPRFAGDELPSGQIGRFVAIADKLDTICGIFAINEPPTGSSDPYAVRRAAIGVIALVRSTANLDLKKLIASSLELYRQQGLVVDESVQSQVEQYFIGRLASIAKDEKISADAIEAVSAIGVINPDEFLQRARALDEARQNEPELFEDLATAYARAAHLSDASLGTEVDTELLTEPEKSLLAACEEGQKQVASALASSDYAAAVSALSQLREPIDIFFDKVLVMDENDTVRRNRLRLLNKFAQVFSNVADISVLSRKK